MDVSRSKRGGARRLIAQLRAAIFLLATLLLPIGAALAWEAGTDGLNPIPPLSARVTDLTQSLSATERQALEAKLADWESRTGNQLVVLLVPSTQPEPIEAYTLRVAEAWKIGRKGQDNGVVMLIAKNDRKARIEVGYGLEGTLTDVTSRRIIAENMAPQFRDGRYGAGIGAAVDRIISTVAEGKPLPPPQKRQAGTPPGGVSLEMLLVVLFVIPLVGSVLRRIFGKLLGSTVGAGLAGGIAWMIAGSLAVAGIAALISFVIMIFGSSSTALAGRRGGGVWFPPSGGGGSWGGGGGWSGGGGGGGFSGGGGGFGGGGASGGWD